MIKIGLCAEQPVQPIKGYIFDLLKSEEAEDRVLNYHISYVFKQRNINTQKGIELYVQKSASARLLTAVVNHCIINLIPLDLNFGNDDCQEINTTFWKEYLKKDTLMIVEEEQGNPFFNAEKAFDGGGYNQPQITFVYNGCIGRFLNNSCGSFGSDYYAVILTEKVIYNAGWGTKNGSPFSTFPDEEPDELKGFYEAFNQMFGKTLPRASNYER